MTRSCGAMWLKLVFKGQIPASGSARAEGCNQFLVDRTKVVSSRVVCQREFEIIGSLR